jgi:hypothetical protein
MVAGTLAPIVVPTLTASTMQAVVAALFTLGASVALWRLWIKFARINEPLRLALATALCASLASVVAAGTVFPAMRRHDNMRPVGAAISAVVAPHHLVIFNPGLHPAPLHWRYYLTVPHIVVAKLGAVPADVAFLCIQESEMKDADVTRRLRENLGFIRNVARVVDNEGRAFIIMTRLPADATGSSGSFPVRARRPPH